MKSEAELSSSAPDMHAGFSYQRQLFPVDIVITYPSDQGTADLALIGEGSDGRDYAIKTVNEGNGYIPITELFCYELARVLGIPTPEFQIVKLRENELAFGSVWEGGSAITKTLPQMFKILKDEVHVRNLKSLISKVYAFDLFVNNIDRHFGNFLFRNSYKNNIGLAYDFGRSWYEVSPYTYDVLETDCNTMKYNNYARKYDKYDRDLASSTLTEISKVERKTISHIFSSAPTEWLADEEREKFLSWWDSEDMVSRINRLKGEL